MEHGDVVDARTTWASFETVVVPLDGSPAAEVAVAVAAMEAVRHAALLVLLRIVAHPELPAGAPSHGPAPAEPAPPTGDLVAAAPTADAYLRRVVERFALPPESACVVRAGDPFAQIVAEVRARPRPVIVLTTKATAVRPLGTHSELARRLLAAGVAPVLAVPPGA